jgi:ABC-2 type transport system permease protein
MIIAKEAKRFFTYRANIFAGLMTVLFTLGARYALWAALFATGNAQQSSLLETMTYFVIHDLVQVWSASRYGDAIGADIRSGDIAQRLIKPYPYHLQLAASFHATSVTATLTRTMPMLIAALLWIGLLPPVSAAAFLAFLLTAVLGGVIHSLVDLIIGYTAFWLTDYWHLSWFKRALFMLFGGAILPLWFYPEWLRAVCGYLPFQYVVYQPMAVYLGRVPSGQIIPSFAMQLFWIAVLFLLERAVWKLTQRKLTVQGG